MSTQKDHQNLFATRDVDGNESSEPEIESEPSDNEGGSPEVNIPPPSQTTDRVDEGEGAAQGAPENPQAGSIHAKVREVLDFMDRQDVKLVDLLDAMSWGDYAATQDAKVRRERTLLLQSPKLSSILDHWATPPRQIGSSKARPQGATATMNTFARDYIKKTVDNELEELAIVFESPTTEDVEKATFIGTTFLDLETKIRRHAPLVWSLLEGLAKRPEQEKNVHKEPDKIVTIIVCVLSYSRSHNRCRFQKLLSVYLKFKGVSAKGFDTLHAMGLTMSYKWTSDAVERMSVASMEEAKVMKDSYPWLISYDNINVPFRVFSQRLDNKEDFGSGTAATIYIKRDAKPLPADANQKLREKRADGITKPLTGIEILDLANDAYPRIRKHLVYQVLRFLLENPDFKLKTYKGRNSDTLKAPPPICELPCGPDHVTLQYLLGTVNIPEASYEDNDRLVNEWLNQMGWSSAEDRKKVATEKIVTWVGDQLTVDRLRGLFKYRAGDDNSFDRLDFSVFLFGWFHCQMAHAKSLHGQYLGTSRGRGLKQAFELLEKKGLSRILTQGPYHNDLNEVLHHIAEAHIIQDWLAVSGVEKLTDLHQKTPEELLALAEKIFLTRASSEALTELEALPEPNQDESLHQIVMWNRDVLHYIILERAIRLGDVGLMEDLLPYLFLRFLGGKNSKYATEVLELLQGLHREWSDDICEMVRKHCWLINTSGKRHLHCPVDRAQEHNIKDIKVTYRSEGPNIKWEFLKRLHPAIHVIRAVAEHVERQFGTQTRGKKHTTPQREKDVRKLQDSYKESGHHKYVAGRKITAPKDRAKDYFKEGTVKLHTEQFLQNWHFSRFYVRSTREDWSAIGEEGSADEGEDDLEGNDGGGGEEPAIVLEEESEDNASEGEEADDES
ncbi:hypothetical protein CVT26_004559 [Gymnopilus dilepis]|uniref:DUF6589 domain-containing protein n=1 Tax=Gymnopilus dilepis TaxID=231916 RepID=A0A409YJ71_9AGAR|nr:hypothetical protein CVT26_004559 [Gymnopilus dilepis]